jgi:chemotaxis methyl-accepting protein methylase
MAEIFVKQMENDREFTFLLDKIMRNRNIDFRQYRPQVLKRRIRHRLHLTGCDTFWDYILMLNKDPQEYDRLIECLTIKESEFFRDSKVFDLLGGMIIPEVISQKQARGARYIRAWSCGAAFGQEAYSIAILFCEALGSGLNDFDIKILATDIDKNALEKAPWGSFDSRALRNMKAHLLFKYFSQFQNGNKVRYTVSDEARALVTFKRHDVLSGSLNPSVDLVLCRNLLIYFQKELQEKALRNLHASLNPGGFLILGKTETITPQMLDYFEVVDLRERIYRKK